MCNRSFVSLVYTCCNCYFYLRRCGGQASLHINVPLRKENILAYNIQYNGFIQRIGGD